MPDDIVSTPQRPPTTAPKGLTIDRLYEGRECVTYEARTITDPATKEEFTFDVPADWSEHAGTILATKYRRKTGVPLNAAPWTHWLEAVEREAITETGGETSARQIFGRLAGAWAHWGLKLGYFDFDNAQQFRRELTAMLEQQVAAPNSPQWFNTGLQWAYGIKGKAQGHYANYPVNAPGAHDFIMECDDAYTRPQVHACFIQGVEDTLVGDNGIMDLMGREARLFKFGSGTGTNYSNLRGKGEGLAAGGTSSGLLSFLRVSDRSAGAIKSGGTTRRAARMVVLDIDHPDIEEFIGWKVGEEDKIRALRDAGIGDGRMDDEAVDTASGQNGNNSVRLTDAFMKAVEDDGDFDLIYRTTGEVAKTVRARDLWDKICEAAWKCAAPGLHFGDTINAWHTCIGDGEITASNPCCAVGATLVETASGRVRIDELEAMHSRGDALPEVWCFDIEKGEPALRKCLRAWKSGESDTLITLTTRHGVAFTCTPEHRVLMGGGEYVQALAVHTGMRVQTIAADHSVPFSEVDEAVDYIYSITHTGGGESVPVYDIEVEDCHNFGVSQSGEDTHSLVVHNSEYLFVDETACNLASLNLAKFLLPNGDFDTASYRHAVRLWTIVLDISVSMAGYPSQQIAEKSIDYRTLGLGYANLGGALMRQGIPYDSDNAREWCSKVTALMGAYSWRTSAELAELLGPFPAYDRNKTSVLHVLDKHWTATSSDTSDTRNTRNAWSVAYVSAKKHGVRNAQCTLLAPTGTISFVMDCDSTGIEPVYALSMMKELAGGGTMQITCPAAEAYLGIKPGDRIPYSPADDSVLACANDISWQGHLGMMAAAQPFLCGAISKTVNMPRTATAEDISAVYKTAHTLGLKAVAVYRDKSKATQVLTADDSTQAEPWDNDAIESVLKGYAADVEDEYERVFTPGLKAPTPDVKFTFRGAASGRTSSAEVTVSNLPKSKVEVIAGSARQTLGLAEEPTVIDRAVEALVNHFTGERGLTRGEREEPPTVRAATVAKLKIAGSTHHATVGRYEDGRVCEVFLSTGKQGGAVQGMADAFAIALSIGLQHGVPLETFVSKLRYQRFEPAGFVSDAPLGITSATSPVDALAQLLGALTRGSPVAVDTPAPPPQVSAPAEPVTSSRVDTGAVCPTCRSTDLQPAGACLTCRACGSSTGCG